jgi:rRNA-processing protein EBP2
MQLHLRGIGCGHQALAAAREAIGKLEASGQKWHRPPDYYAEMVKSDEHMARVKQQLMHEQAEIAGAEERCAQAVSTTGSLKT